MSEGDETVHAGARALTGIARAEHTRSRYRWACLAAALILLGGISQTSRATASGHPQSRALKKTCKYVTKKVHGKKTRVKVCKTVKPTPTPAPTPTQPSISPPAPRILTTIPCSCTGEMTFAFGSLWVNRGPFDKSDTVTRIDPTTGNVVATIPVPVGGGEIIDSGFGSIWEVDFAGTTGNGTVTRIDPQTNRVLATVSTRGTSPYGLAISPQAVWVANHNEPAIPGGATVAKLDPSSNAVIDTVPVGGQQGGPGLLLYSAGSIWAFDQIRITIDRIDPVSDKVVASIPTRSQGIQHRFAGDGSRVWSSVPGGGPGGAEVQQVDTAANTVKTLVAPEALAHYGLTDIYGLQFGGGFLWATGPCGQVACIVKINPETGAISSAWSMLAGDPADPGFGGFLYADGGLWVVAGTASAPEVDRLDIGS